VKVIGQVKLSAAHISTLISLWGVFHNKHSFLVIVPVYVYTNQQKRNVNYRPPPNILTMHNRPTPDNNGLSLSLNNWLCHVCSSVLLITQVRICFKSCLKLDSKPQSSGLRVASLRVRAAVITCFKKKKKQSRYRSGGAQRVPGS